MVLSWFMQIQHNQHFLFGGSMPLNFWVLLVGFFRRNHGHAWPFRCRVEPSMKLWCRKGAPQLGQSLQMKAAQVIHVHMSTVLEGTYWKNAPKVKMSNSLEAQYHNTYFNWYLRQHGPSTEKKQAGLGGAACTKAQARETCLCLKVAQAGRKHWWPAANMQAMAMFVLQPFTFDIFIYVRP